VIFEQARHRSRCGHVALGGRVLLALCLATGLATAEPQGPDLESWLATLRVGMWVKVEGQRALDGILEASRVRVYDGERDEVAVETEVAAVDLARMTLETSLGLRVVATPSTEIEGPGHRRHFVLAGVGVGDRVEVEGQLERDGSLRAEKIDIETSKRLEPGRGPENKHKLTARIESIDAAGHRIVVLGLPVQLKRTTRIRLPD